MPRSEVVPLLAESVPLAGEVCARAFARTAVFRSLIPDPDDRMRALTEIYACLLRYGCQHGLVWASSEDLEGVGMMLPARAAGYPVGAMIRSGGLRLLRTLPWRLLLRLKAFEQDLLEVREALVQLPHWYLAFICVDPESQHGGHGRAVLEAMLAVASDSGAPCYLETHLAEILPILRRYNFRVLRSFTPRGVSARHWACSNAPVLRTDPNVV